MAMKVFNVGDVLGAADVNEYGVNTKFAFKASPLTRSGTSVSDDPDLVLNIGTSRIFILELIVPFQGGSGGLKFAFSGPAGSSLNGYWQVTSSQGSGIGPVQGGTYDGGVNTNLSTAFTVTPLSALGLTDTLAVRGFLSTTGTAGNFTFRWSLNSASGNITASAGSSMLIRRVS